jgi:DNA-directed RNA polymerase specialized sigma24 family protein
LTKPEAALDQVEELLRINWKDTGIRLAGYAAFRARNLRWRTGNADSLAKGLMPEDIAAQAILGVISGEREWDPERGPLLPYLKRIVDSLLSHLAESSDNRRLTPILTEDMDGGLEVSSGEAADARLQQLFAVAEGKPELTEVLQAMIEFDDVRPRVIAVRVGRPVSHVNNCMKRLRRLALKIAETSGRRPVSTGASVSPS